jgi:hypothetical protein
MALLLRPLTLGELLDRAFQVYRSRFGVFVGIAAMAYLPLFVVQAGMLWLPKVFAPAGQTSPLAAVFGVSILIGLVLRFFAVAAATSATIIVVSAVYLEQPITMSEAYRRVSGMLFRVFFIMIGMGIGIGVGTLLLIIPGIILFVMWGLAIPVAVLEDAGLGESLSRSRELTAGHRFRVVAIYLLYFALILSLEFGLMLPVGVVIALTKGSGAPTTAAPLINVASIIVGYLIESLITPILTIALSLMYYDERVRKEAFDIQLMMIALGDGGTKAAVAGTT